LITTGRDTPGRVVSPAEEQRGSSGELALLSDETAARTVKVAVEQVADHRTNRPRRYTKRLPGRAALGVGETCTARGNEVRLDMAPLVKTAAKVRLRDDGTLRIAAVADTHSHPHPSTPALLATEKPDAIIHAGDIDDLAVLRQLGEIAPVYAVRGNIDTRRCAPDVLCSMRWRATASGFAPGRPHRRQRNASTRRRREDGAGRARHAVVCGHRTCPSSVRRESRGSTLARSARAGSRYRSFRHDRHHAKRVRLAHVDAETGRA
jgi:hypothetical protein